MKHRITQWASCAVVALCLGLSGEAFAAKDKIYPSAAAATANTVDMGIPAADKSFTPGGNGSITLGNVFPTEAIVVTVTWSIQDNAGPGTNTDYSSSRTVTFARSTTMKPVGAADVTIASITGCSIAKSGSSPNFTYSACVRDVNFSAPATLGNYQIEITATDPGVPANTRIEGTNMLINFTVVAPPVSDPPVVVKRDTQLTVDQQCVLLHQSNVNLTATLQELDDPDTKIPGATITYYVNPALDGAGIPTVPAVGSAATNTDGVASFAYNPGALAVGDHNLYAEYAGSDTYNPSNDSDILGVSYLFQGFGQPINGDGTSIFGGRVIPIKIKLVDANGIAVTNAAPTVWLTSYSTSTGLGTDLEQVSSVSTADTDNIMRYSTDDQQYIYNWDATSLPNGTYAVVVDLGDSVACSPGPRYAIITVARKTKK